MGVVFIFAALAPGGPFLLPIVKSTRLVRLSSSSVRFSTLKLSACGLLLVPFVAAPAWAQTSTLPDPPVTNNPIPDNSEPPAPPADEPAPDDTTPEPGEPIAPGVDGPQVDTTAPSLELNPTPDSPPKAVSSGRDLPAPATPPTQLFATNFSTNNGVITAEGTAESPVRFVSGLGEVRAQRIVVDTIKKTAEATGKVILERVVPIQRREIRSRVIGRRKVDDTAKETLVGENLQLDFNSSTGKLDNVEVQLASFSISASSIIINGQRYSATNVIVRPGALSEEERKIYGTPPLNIRVKNLEAKVGENNQRDIVSAKGGGLYFRNTRILPMPAYIFRAGLGGGEGSESAYSLTPGISFNSADRILLTTKVTIPLSKNPEKLSTSFDIGLSQRVGLRGGVRVETEGNYGRLGLNLRRHDIVTTQLTNRIELDRTPELNYRSPALATINLPGGRLAGFRFTATYGNYSERTIGTNAGAVDSKRLFGRVLFSTRLKNVDGPFLDLFASTARYSAAEDRYGSRGFTLGYEGNLLPRVRGRVSYTSASLSGNTPFRFDEVQIRRELRTTFDISLTPRYLIPIDLRYDMSQDRFRDKTFGILRSYKTFAYGVVYQTARRDLRMEVRQGF